MVYMTDFYVLDPPREIDGYCFKPDNYNKKPDLVNLYNEEKNNLTDGEELYIYDSMRFMKGFAGLAIVKDGKVIKFKNFGFS